MGYKVEYSQLAINDMEEIAAYLLQYAPDTAKKFFDVLEKETGYLKKHPLMYEAYGDYRRMIVEDYLVFYKVMESEQRVRISRVLHGRRNIKKYLT